MRILFLILFIAITLIGCQQTLNEEEDLLEVPDGVDIYDFYFINRAPERAPEATEKHPLNELIKIYFSTKAVAIDVGNNELLEKPRFATSGVTIFEEPLPFDDKEGLLGILEKYNVQEWKANYTTADPDTYDDGYGWMMLLQFEDGTVERYQGLGSYKEDVVPENFDEFADEMEAFKEEKVKEGTK